MSSIGRIIGFSTWQLPSRRELIFSAALFFFVVIISFYPIVFRDRSLVASDNYNPLDYRFLAGNYGSHPIPATVWSKRGLLPYANLLDPGSAWWQGEPSLAFFGHAVRSGQFPFWDPYAGCGAPAYSTLVPSMLFPPQALLSLAGGTSSQKNVYTLFLFWLSSFACYGFLRLHSISTIPSVLGGLAFLFSGAVQQIAHISFMLQVVACIPLVLIATKLFVDNPSWRRTSGLAITYAFVALASFPPLLEASFGFCIVYFVGTLLLESQNSRRLLILRFVCGILLSVALVAVYYLPALHTVSRATQITALYQTAGRLVLPWYSAFDLFSPTAGGGYLVYSAPAIEPAANGHLFYVGATVFLLALLALGRPNRPSRSLSITCATAAVLVLMKVFGVPPVQWIGFAPLFQAIHYSNYFGVLLAFLVSVLAAIGADRLLRRDISVGSFLFAGVTLITGLVALWRFAVIVGAVRRPTPLHWVTDYHLLIGFSAAAIILGACGLLRSSFPSLATVLLGCLILIEGLVNATYPRQRRWDAFQHPPNYIRMLKNRAEDSRVFVAGALNANLGSAFQIPELDSLYTFASPRIYELYMRYTKAARWIFLREAKALPPDSVLDSAGIGRVLVQLALDDMRRAANDRGLPSIYMDDFVEIFHRPSAKRVFFSSDYRISDRTAALDLVSAIRPRGVVLEEAAPFSSAANRPDDPDPEITSSKLNSLSIRVHAPRSGLVYIADTYDDGWSARINGRPATIYVANYAFRAVAVPRGDLQVELSYMPPGLISGFFISAVALGLALGLIIKNGPRKEAISAESKRRPSVNV